MSKKGKTEKSSKSNILYDSKDLKIFTDITKAAEAEATYISMQDPVDRIRETVQLILKVFPLSEKKPNTNKIYFDDWYFIFGENRNVK